MDGEQSQPIAADGCIYEGEPLSFPCIMSIINDVRSGTVGLKTVRKAIRQVDNGIAMLAGDDADVNFASSSSPAGSDLTAICDQLEAACSASSVTAAGVNPSLLSLLISLLMALLDHLAA